VENEASGFTYWGSSGITTNCEFKNNIIHTSAEYLAFISPGSALAGGWTLDYNNYYPDGAAAFYYAGDDYTFANWKIATGGDANSIVTDPKFVTNGTDFHLQLGSGAINEGVNVGLSTDMDGVAVADPPEIGAFEYI
jgi:hypothetical protein